MKIPSSIKAAIKAGKTVFWLEKPTVKKVRSRCNCYAWSLCSIEDDLKCLLRPCSRYKLTKLGSNEVITPDEVYIDVELIKYFRSYFLYEQLEKLNWFKDTIENRYTLSESSFRYSDKDAGWERLFEKAE